jgi:hypothetical protein
MRKVLLGKEPPKTNEKLSQVFKLGDDNLVLPDLY